MQNSTKTIWKYPLQLVDKQVIDMPYGAKLLTVQVQHEIPCVWVAVDQPEPIFKAPVTFWIVGTGRQIPMEAVTKSGYLGSFQLDGGHLVFHVFFLLGYQEDEIH